MKKYILILFVLAAGLSSCKKTTDFDPVAQAAADDAKIQAYLKANNITAVKDLSGIYYVITKQGAGAYPTGSSTVTVNYVGKILAGATFETGTNFQTALNAVIAGWKVGLQHINAGGAITLYIPSGQAYGNNDNGSIPANSVLVFDITLVSIP